jgi:pimeloyl-ACP methyl ester carboxylesterase
MNTGHARLFTRWGTHASERLPDLPPPTKTLTVRAADGTPLHAEVFGPPDGYPIVLTHGFTCAIRVWAYQIAELAGDYRVIAFDHRGHGRSGVPRRGGYRLEYLASDLDSVLEATVAPHERAVLAGHSMGGITIAAWSEQFRDKVRQRVDAVALINTTTGELLRRLDLLQFPAELSLIRTLGGRALVGAFGGFPLPGLARIPANICVEMLALGAGADRNAVKLIAELFEQTSPAGRGGAARMLVESVGRRYLRLDGLTVPTLVIGSQRDRLTPISQSRRIAQTAPRVVGFVELPGGHCSMLEQHEAVNRELRGLAESVTHHAKSG